MAESVKNSYEDIFIGGDWEIDLDDYFAFWSEVNPDYYDESDSTMEEPVEEMDEGETPQDYYYIEDVEDEVEMCFEVEESLYGIYDPEFPEWVVEWALEYSDNLQVREIYEDLELRIENYRKNKGKEHKKEGDRKLMFKPFEPQNVAAVPIEE